MTVGDIILPWIEVQYSYPIETFAKIFTPCQGLLLAACSHMVFQVTLADGSGGKLTIYQANKGNIRYQMDEIQFSDGTVWTWATMFEQQ